MAFQHTGYVLGISFSPLDDAVRRQWDSLLDTLAGISARHPDAVMASSLAVEDMLLAHAIFQAGLPITVFTLDTGRLHPETLAMVGRIRQRYGVDLLVVKPDAQAVREHVAQHGEYAFYESTGLRKVCCGIRKVEPLRRVLKGRSAWLTGQHRDQSVTREKLPEAEYDEVFGLHKYNPLAGWSSEQVWAVVRAFGIPYNPLHDQGYPSIGCEPCTRAVRPGEDARAGRWCWENSSSKECGLHEANLKFYKANDNG